MNRRFIIAAGLVAVLAVVLVAAFARPAHAPIVARVETVSYGSYVQRLPETGVVERPQIDTLTAETAGNIGGIHAAPGQRVNAGDVLVTIVNPQLEAGVATAQANYDAAAGRLASARQTAAALPAQNASAVQQARSNLEQARFTLSAALTDQHNGAQSGLGYGGTTAQSQRVAADANVANAQTSLNEAQRIYDADVDLYKNRAISKDALSQQAARLDQARISAEQARRQRDDTYKQLQQNTSVLADRVSAARDGVRQAQAALHAAQVQAQQTKTGDVAAAAGDAAARLDDLRYAREQVTRLTVRAPFTGVVQTIASEAGDSLRPLQPGDPVVAGQALVTMAPDEGFIVRVRVDEQDIAHVRTGEAARISGEDLGGATLPGHVVAVGAVAQKSDDPANTARQVITTVKLDGTRPYLRDGMNVDVDLVTLERKHVLTVATDAVRRDGANAYVFAVGSDGHARKTPVVLGEGGEERTVIVSGLRPGARVVDDRNPAIADNVAITPAPAASPSPAAGSGAA